MGTFDTTVEELPSPKAKFAPHPQISGKNGGESPNLHQFARDGVILLGHVRDTREGKLIIAPDMKESLGKVDAFETEALKKIDDYIARKGLNAPKERVTQRRDGYEQEIIAEPDLRAFRISTIIRATGYSFDFSLVKLPITDADGYPIPKARRYALQGPLFSDSRDSASKQQ